MAANPIVPESELHIDAERSATEVVFRCIGRINSSTCHELQEAVRGALQRTNVVLDLSRVNHMDSSGLGTLVGLWVSAKKAGRQIELVSLSDRVKELLHLTSLDKVFATTRFPDQPSF